MQEDRAIWVLTLSHVSKVDQKRHSARLISWARGASGGAIGADGMVRDILMKIREHEQQIQHAFALPGVGFADFLFQVGYDGERVGEQPFEITRSQRSTFAATGESVVGADECFVEKMIQTKLLGSECSRDRLLARGPSTTPEDRSAHGTPHVPSYNSRDNWTRAYHRILGAAEVSRSCCVEDRGNGRDRRWNVSQIADAVFGTLR